MRHCQCSCFFFLFIYISIPIRDCELSHSEQNSGDHRLNIRFRVFIYDCPSESVTYYSTCCFQLTRQVHTAEITAPQEFQLFKLPNDWFQKDALAEESGKHSPSAENLVDGVSYHLQPLNTSTERIFYHLNYI